MSSVDKKIFIGTVLLEKNRWKSRIPSLLVSEWVDRFKKDGFDGMELWENHVLLNSPEELDALKNSGFPVTVYNSYVTFDDEGAEKRAQAADAACKLGAKAVKFNFGNDMSLRDTYIKNLKDWVSKLPSDCRILCECHSGTIMEDPAFAAEVFKELGEDRYQAIVHGMIEPSELEKWFNHLGKAITHVHVQALQDGKYVRLRKIPERLKENLKIMKDAGFAGSYTIEFAEGCATPDENIEDVYSSALDDLQVLREALV